MKTTTAGEDAVLQARQSAHHLRVEIKNAAGAWVTYDAVSSIDWQDRVEIQKDVNQRVAQLTVAIAREADGNSLAPLINVDIDAGRAIRVSAARVAVGATPDAADYKPLFLGEVDRWDAAQDPVQLMARDDMGHLVDRWIEEETEYGSEDGVAIETVMATILSAWTDGRFTLYTPASPGFLITRYRQQRESVLSALQALADLIGWVVDYEWDDGTSAFRLTFSEPDRTPVATAWTFGPNDYYDVEELAVDRLDVRNVVAVRYTDAATDARSAYTAEDAASITKYGRRWMEIEEGDDSPIDSDAEAQTLADAAVSDLATPVAQQAITTDVFWPLQLGDFYTFAANGVHYDVAQDFAVTGYVHTFDAGSATTRISTRGTGAVAHTRGWLKREAKPRPPQEVEAGLKLIDFRETKRTATTITYEWTLGSGLDESWIHDYQRDQPYASDQWPGLTRPPDTVSLDRTVEYTVAIPEAGKVGYLQVEGRRDSSSTAEDMERVLIFPTSVAGDYIAFAVCTVRQSDGSAKVSGWTTDRALSVAHAANVGEADAVSAPSEAVTEAQGVGADVGGLVTGFTSDFEVTYPAGTVPYGETIKGLLIAYINADGTGPDGTRQDHDTPVGFQGERIKITSADAITDGIVVAAKLKEAARSFITDVVFSASDWDTVEWTSGTLTLGDGTSYAINAGDTGDLATDALRYILLDSGISGTTLQVVTATADAVGEDAVLLCVAKRATAGGGSGQLAFYVPAVGVLGINADVVGPASITETAISNDSISTPKIKALAISTDKLAANAVTAAKITAGTITANEIAANTITAAEMNVASLSAISADIGTVTAGVLQNAAGTRFIDLDATGTGAFIKHDNFELLADGSATFSGTVNASTFTASVATFSGKIVTDRVGDGATLRLISGPASMLLTDSADTISIGGTATGIMVAASGGKVGFYGATAVSKQTSVAVTATAIHAALVSLGLIS